MKLPPLLPLRVFEVVSRHTSIRRAAEELGTNHTAVSRHMKVLQESLNTVLLKTTPCGTALTDAGVEYAAATRRGLMEISAATLALKKGRRSNKLIVWCRSGFAELFLAPRLAEFESLHPQFSVSLRPNDNDPNFIAQEADVQIRVGASPASNVNQVLLCRPDTYPVASPAWFARNARPKRVVDLLACRIIDFEDPYVIRWFHDRGIDGRIEFDGPKVWNLRMALEAAKAGHGIALVNELILERYIGEGSLEIIDVGRPRIPAEPYTFVVRNDIRSDPAVTSFHRWLTNELSERRGAQPIREAAGSPRRAVTFAVSDSR
jgi:LysR family glycine cleavage system transcriptional activator